MIFLKAFAKINLGLKILKKREDGFHDIETTLTTITLSDKISIEESDKGIKIQCPGLNIPDNENLVYKTAELFLSKYNVTKGIKIDIQKNIPIGGGLGGGSSDAATVLNGLRSLFNLNVSDEELMGLGRNLGCDVPFFIKGGAAIAKGRGDELKFFKLPRTMLVIYYPGYSISTKWAYEEYDKWALTKGSVLDIIEGNEGKKKKARGGFDLKNDIEGVVFKGHPDLQDVKMKLLGSGAFIVSLSGSGSCLYVVVDENTKKKVIKYLSSIGATYFEVETI